MNYLKLVFVNVVLATIFLSLTYASLDQNDSHNVESKMSDTDDHIMPSDLEDTSTITSSLRRSRRFRGQKHLPASYTCNKFPRVCRLKGSAGPDCCKKKCVNIMKDRLNCGMCGLKCKYNEICCNGKCVNASFDKKHCGGCQNKCKKGDVCVFGMCSYA
ncbi:Stigma-specific protein Stig1 [Heracleum sosnowskyi]|uniref:Stigma-specific protein Stig1 n=1 Tax=Heracleum sosnowskyi TaxID=360622 RepID=A0AAD8MAI8_9APIA|nr:Stigma-specific protein Stig1 [Heracleum sosnowskyi]